MANYNFFVSLRARTHARTHAREPACMSAHTRTHMHSQTQPHRCKHTRTHMQTLMHTNEHRRIQGGPGGHVPPLDRLKCILFLELFCLRHWRCLASNVRIAGDQQMCGKNRAGFRRPRKISATTPPPQSVVVPLLDYPLWIRRPCMMSTPTGAHSCTHSSAHRPTFACT